MPKRTVKKVYSDSLVDNVGTKYYDPKYVSPRQIEEDELVKTKLITRRSGQKVIKKKGERRRKVDSFYEDTPFNRKDLERNASMLMKTSMYGGDDDPVDKTKATTPGEHNIKTLKNVGKNILKTGLGVDKIEAGIRAFEKLEQKVKKLFN